MKRSFPYACANCGLDSVTRTHVHYEFQALHDGVLSDFYVPNLPILKCWSCGEMFFDDRADDEMNEAIRRRLGLLSPFEIQSALHEWGWTVEDLATVLDLDIQKIVDGLYIQSTETDKQIRKVLEL